MERELCAEDDGWSRRRIELQHSLLKKSTDPLPLGAVHDIDYCLTDHGGMRSCPVLCPKWHNLSGLRSWIMRM
jgi:hypothetical protein